MASIADKLFSIELFRRKPRAVAYQPNDNVLAHYTGSNAMRRNRKRLMWLFGGLSFFYGIAFALLSTFFLLQLALPLIVLALLVVWLLPEMGWAPVNLLDKLLLWFIVALLCWPDYLALAFPGLPWITAIRLVGIPLALTMLISLSVSGDFRKKLLETINSAPAVWKLLAAFIVTALVSIAFSKDIGLSVNKFIVAQLYWTSIFFAAAYVFTRPGRSVLLTYMLWIVVLLVSFIGVWEWRLQSIPWAGSIPSFLKIEDPVVQNILSAKSRAATGIYRVQSKFTTPLGLAEFLALATPFVLHLLMTTRYMVVRLGAMATIPLIFYVIILTDSRLGAVGFFMSFLLYLLAWGALRWRKHEDSLFGPAVVISYPLIFVMFIISTFFVGRLRAMVWGTGAQKFSTQSREAQFDAGIPMVLKHPWGHGIGRGAETLNFRNQAGELTIDTYFLAVGLEYGVIGFFVYYGMFLYAIWYGAKALIDARTRDTFVLAPLCIALTNFFIIKSIFSQQENHPLVFALLGAVVALVWRAKQDEKAGALTPAERDAI